MGDLNAGVGLFDQFTIDDFRHGSGGHFADRGCFGKRQYHRSPSDRDGHAPREGPDAEGTILASLGNRGCAVS